MKFEVADPILSKTAMQKLLRLVLLHHSDSLFAYLCRGMAAPEPTRQGTDRFVAKLA